MYFKETGNLKTHMKSVRHVRSLNSRKIVDDLCVLIAIKLSLPKVI